MFYVGFDVYFGWSHCPHQSHWLHPNPTSKKKTSSERMEASIPQRNTHINRELYNQTIFK